MLLQMTVIDARRSTERRVEVLAEARHTALHLLAALDTPTDTPLRVNGGKVSPQAPIGLPPLLDGSVLVLDHDDGPVTKTTPTSPLRLTTTTGPDSGRTLALTPGRHVIGRGDRASLRVDDETLSREHLAVMVDRDGVLVHELDATNATLVDGDGVPSTGVRVPSGSRVRAGHTTFALEARRSRPSRRRPSGAGTVMVNPTPHLPSAHVPTRITLPQEPSAPARRRIPWMMVLLPLPFAALLAVFFGPRMLLFGLLTPVLAIGSALSDRSSARRDHREARREWVTQCARVGEYLANALAAERRERLRSAPDATALLDAARGDSPWLWERRAGHPHHLNLRLGMAPLPARIEVDHGHGDRAHPVLEDVPLVVNLDEVGVLGIAGGRHDRDRLARHLLGQLMVLHSHHDVQISVVATDEGWWSPFRALVHLREHGDVPGSSRATTHEDEAVALFAGHAGAARERARRRSERQTEEAGPTALVLVVDDVERWRTDPNLRTVLAEGRARGVLVVALADTVDGLPHECGAVVRLRGDDVTLQVASTRAARGVVDGVGPSWARRLAAALAPLRDATPDAAGAGLPEETRLIDLVGLDPDDTTGVRAAWAGPARSGPTDLDVVVGQGADGEFRIDLRSDGPHALVAGTTGSGKSEFLQSWVAALATRLSPEQITFVLVDYKGGAAFAECARLPHTVGVLTDLEPAQAERALTSLDAELTRRERILAASGAKDIDDHRGNSLPRLMIVIDEFRMLAEEQPEALAHLMKIAAVGRSLGVHLVLATQRPGGIVSADIKANVNLRIALRVRDRVDSDDVLGCPDAVDLPEIAPGRALARTGGSPARSFQTGRVAGHGTSTSVGVLVREPGTAWPATAQRTDLGPTDLQRLATTLTAVAADLGITEPHRPWLPPLAETITTEDIPFTGDDPGAPFALLDRPEQQEQVPLTWSPTGGHWMVVGGPGTGRTTSIAAIVTAAGRRWAPGRLQVQVIGDGSSLLGDLARLPHVGSVVDGEDRPLTRRFLTRLEDDVTRRRARLRASGYSTLDAWWAAHEAEPAGDAPPPHLLLAVDGWARVTQPRGGADLGETAELLETLLRDGMAAGVCAVITGGRELLSGRISSLVTSRLVLHLPDRGDASLAGLKPSETSGKRIPGRARLQPGGYLVQVAQPCGESSAGARRALCGDEQPRAWRIEPLPEEVAVARLPEATTARMPLGIGGSGREPVVWRVPGARRMLVCGPPGSGRTTTLATIARQAIAAGHPVALIGESDLTDRPDLSDAIVCDPEDRDGLIALRRTHPDLAIMIDDADRVEDEPVADVVKEVLRRVDSDRGLVVASTTTQTAATRVRGLVAEIGRSRAGVLLQPTSRSDGDALGLRVPPLPRIPGRGYLITQGRAEEIQMASGPAPGGQG